MLRTGYEDPKQDRRRRADERQSRGVVRPPRRDRRSERQRAQLLKPAKRGK